MTSMRVAGTALIALVLASPATAATFTLSNYTVTLHDEDPGLVVYSSDLASKPFSFDLAGIGDQQTVALFRLGTHEGFVNWEDGEDTAAHPISVLFEFSEPAPAFDGTATGTTSGVVNTSNFAFLDPCWKIYGGCGRVQWNNPTLLAFGATGVLSITLTERKFRADDYSRIDATFTWLEGELANPGDEAQVPEPTIMLLSVTGLAAGLVRRRRSRTAA